MIFGIRAAANKRKARKANEAAEEERSQNAAVNDTQHQPNQGSGSNHSPQPQSYYNDQHQQQQAAASTSNDYVYNKNKGLVCNTIKYAKQNVKSAVSGNNNSSPNQMPQQQPYHTQ